MHLQIFCLLEWGQSTLIRILLLCSHLLLSLLSLLLLVGAGRTWSFWRVFFHTRGQYNAGCMYCVYTAMMLWSRIANNFVCLLTVFGFCCFFLCGHGYGACHGFYVSSQDDWFSDLVVYAVGLSSELLIVHTYMYMYVCRCVAVIKRFN